MFKKRPILKYILSKGLWYLFTFFATVTIVFILPRLGGANPVDIIMGKVASGLSSEAAQKKEEAYLKEFNLVKTDKDGRIIRDESGAPVKTSVFKQYFNYLCMTIRFDFGTSFLYYPKKVKEIMADAIIWDFFLQVPAIVLGWILGNILGALAAYKRGVFDKVLFPASLFISSIPFFAFGLLLLFIFAIVWPIFPSAGGYAENIIPSFSWDFLSSLGFHYTLPFLSIFLVIIGDYSIGMRSMGIYELGTDYIKYAKSLGIKEFTIMWYVFRNGLLPQLAGVAILLGQIIGGALVAEIIFSYPGLGTTILHAIQGNDYSLIQGTSIVVAIMILIANFSVDILIGIFDPRVRAGIKGV